MDLLALYAETFGWSPLQLLLLEREVTAGEVDRMIQRWQTELERPLVAPRSEDQVCPLVSHHPFNRLSLFGNGPRETIGERALGMLFAHDTLVCSDPMWEIVDVRARQGVDAAAAKINELTGRIAGVEHLIEAGVLRFTSARPALDDSSRTAVLRAFGVEPTMRVFTNFEQAADAAAMVGGAAARSYIDQGIDLSFRFGILQPDFASRTLPAQVEETRQRVQRIGQAILHLSWQLSVASSDKSVDLALGGGVEAGLLEYLVESTELVRPHLLLGTERTRHLLRAAAGEIPNMDRIDLSDSDALAIRSDDSFAEFRGDLHAALDDFESVVADRADADRAVDAFAARMADAADRLKRRAAKASFAASLKNSVVPIGIEAAVAATSSSDEQLKSAAVATGGAIAAVVWSWLHARSHQQGARVAIRYTSMLGVPRPHADDE